MPHASMLGCADDSLDVGSTRNLDARMQQHAIGRGAVYTSTRLPGELVWAAEYARVDEAWAVERRLHGWGRAKREAPIRGDCDLISKASRRRGLDG
jgi:putative endonuclease